MYTIGLLENRIVLNNTDARPVYTVYKESAAYAMLDKLALLGVVYLKDLHVLCRMEYYTLIDIIEEQEEMEFRRQLQKLVAPLVLHPATVNN